MLAMHCLSKCIGIIRSGENPFANVYHIFAAKPAWAKSEAIICRVA